MDRERDIKAKPEHWAVILDYLEEHPQLINNKFSEYDGDNTKNQKLWKNLVDHLNGLGYGVKPQNKWQLAIGRWKSKVKAKAAAIRCEEMGTGGGPRKTQPLSSMEQRLMSLVGWKAVTGDENVELGLNKLQQTLQESREIPQSPGGEEKDHAKECRVVESRKETPPPLLFRNENFQGAISRVTERTMPKRKADIQGNNAVTKRKLATTTVKSRKFLSMSHMHSETMTVLKDIANHLHNISNNQLQLTCTIEKYCNYQMSLNTDD